MARSLAGRLNHPVSRFPAADTFRREAADPRNEAHTQVRRFAGSFDRTRRRGRGVVYVTPGCFAHPNCQTFWLGGVSGGGQLSEGRRAQGQYGMV